MLFSQIARNLLNKFHWGDKIVHFITLHF